MKMRGSSKPLIPLNGAKVVIFLYSTNILPFFLVFCSFFICFGGLNAPITLITRLFRSPLIKHPAHEKHHDEQHHEGEAHDGPHEADVVVGLFPHFCCGASSER